MGIGSFIAGAAIAGLSAWLGSLAAKKKDKREQREQFLELVGRQQALIHRGKTSGIGENEVMEKYVDWLEKENPPTATLALVIGYMEEGNKEIEAQSKQIQRLERVVSTAHEEQQRLQKKLADLRSNVSKTGEK